MEWSRELIECCIANCSEERDMNTVFLSSMAARTVAEAIDMMEKEGRYVDGIIMSYFMFKQLNINRSFVNDYVESSGFTLFGIPAIPYPDIDCEGVYSRMYLLCDFFDNEKSNVIMIKYFGFDLRYHVNTDGRGILCNG